MKKINFIVVLTFLILSACSTQKLPFHVEVLKAEYEIITGQVENLNERGYKVYMEVKNLEGVALIKQIVLNQMLFDTRESVSLGTRNSIIDQYFPVQSMRIENFESPKTDKRKDGIVFEYEEKEYFYEINFKLK